MSYAWLLNTYFAPCPQDSSRSLSNKEQLGLDSEAIRTQIATPQV